MNLDAKDKETLSDARMEKAKEFLADAEALWRQRRYRSTVNRAYYAALSAVRSVLILAGVNPESHEGAATLLSLRFVKPGLLPVDITKAFRTLLSRRTDVDYGDFDSVGPEEAEHSLAEAKRIMEALDPLRKRLTSAPSAHSPQ
jgi:uncharacterized protein (UPF0332 family)